MRTLYYSKAEKSLLKFFLDIYGLGREMVVSKNGREYIVNSYYISKSVIGIAMGLHPQTITRAINNLSDKKIIKIISIVSNKSVKGSIIYFNSDLYLHPETIKELSDLLDYIDISNEEDGYIYEKITKFEIDNFLSNKHKGLDINGGEDIEEEVEPIKEGLKEELKKDRNDITLLYKMFLKQNKTILKSLDLIAEQNKVFAEQNKAVVKSLDLLSEVIGKIGSVGTINQVVDKTILNNPKVDSQPQFTAVDKEDEEQFIINDTENNEPTENAENTTNNGLITISNEKKIINGEEVITIGAEHSIVDTGPDIDAYLYENDEEYAKEVAGIKDRDDITDKDLDYFRYLKNISNNFYHKFYDKAPRYRYTYGLQYLADLICYRFSILTGLSDMLIYKEKVDKEGWITYYLLNSDSYVQNVINTLPIPPESATVSELGLILNYSENIPNIVEPYSYKSGFDFCYKKFYCYDDNIGDMSVKLEYERTDNPVSLYGGDLSICMDIELGKHRLELDYSKKHILFKLFYISLKRSQITRVGHFNLSRNSYYIGDNGELVMHKAIWLIINKVDYQPFVKQLLIDYTEWCCGGGKDWVQEIEKYIIPKKRISTRRIYNGLKNGLPEYDIEYIESELLDGHLIRRIYEKMIDGHFISGYALGLDQAGLGKASKKDIPDYRTDTREYEDLFYRFIGLEKTAFGYKSMSGIIPIAKNDFEFYKRMVEERVIAWISAGIYGSITNEESKVKDKNERRKIWAKYMPQLRKEISFDEIMYYKNYLEDEEDLSESEKKFIEDYPNLILSLIHETVGNYYSFNTLKKHIREKLDLLRKELKRDKKADTEDGRLGLKSQRDIKKIADNLNENQKNYI